MTTMAQTDAKNLLRSAIDMYCRAEGFGTLPSCTLDILLDQTCDVLDEGLDAYNEDGQGEAPLDTPSLDTSFHDNEMAVD